MFSSSEPEPGSGSGSVSGWYSRAPSWIRRPAIVSRPPHKRTKNPAIPRNAKYASEGQVTGKHGGGFPFCKGCTPKYARVIIVIPTARIGRPTRRLGFRLRRRNGTRNHNESCL